MAGLRLAGVARRRPDDRATSSRGSGRPAALRALDLEEAARDEPRADRAPVRRRRPRRSRTRDADVPPSPAGARPGCWPRCSGRVDWLCIAGPRCDGARCGARSSRRAPDRAGRGPARGRGPRRYQAGRPRRRRARLPAPRRGCPTAASCRACWRRSPTVRATPVSSSCAAAQAGARRPDHVEVPVELELRGTLRARRSASCAGWKRSAGWSRSVTLRLERPQHGSGDRVVRATDTLHAAHLPFADRRGRGAGARPRGTRMIRAR